MTERIQQPIVLALAMAVMLATPFTVGATEFSDPNEDKLSPRADLEQVITVTANNEKTFLKAKKAFSEWSIDDGVLVMPGDRVVPDGAPSTFLKAKKAFVEVGDDYKFVMPGDNVTATEPD